MRLEIRPDTPERWPDIVELYRRAGFLHVREASKRAIVRRER